MWFRIAEEAIGRMPEKTPRDRGARLVDALLVWITPDRPIEPGINRFEVRVSEAGDTWIERLAVVRMMDSIAPRRRGRAPDADRPTPRRGIPQPEHPPGVHRVPPPRRLARRPAAPRPDNPVSLTVFPQGGENQRFNHWEANPRCSG